MLQLHSSKILGPYQRSTASDLILSETGSISRRCKEFERIIPSVQNAQEENAK
jgi:hypothetical protein